MQSEVILPKKTPLLLSYNAQITKAWSKEIILWKYCQHRFWAVLIEQSPLYKDYNS